MYKESHRLCVMCVPVVMIAAECIQVSVNKQISTGDGFVEDYASNHKGTEAIQNHNRIDCEHISQELFIR